MRIRNPHWMDPRDNNVRPTAWSISGTTGMDARTGTVPESSVDARMSELGLRFETSQQDGSHLRLTSSGKSFLNDRSLTHSPWTLIRIANQPSTLPARDPRKVLAM